ncbi:MAG: hypothetical protein MUC61_02455 [Amoebophilaceae bacterium]|nr:hypothetical protein [Amoebophilaceae bacterium]
MATKPKSKAQWTIPSNNKTKATLMAHAASSLLISVLKLCMTLVSSLTSSTASSSKPKSRKNIFLHLIRIGT